MSRSSLLDRTFIDPEVWSFFIALKENPDDDAPRLIFADWLQERGGAAASARGEFLRLNVLRHRLSPDDPSYDLLKRREGELLTEHRWTWLGPLVDAARSWTFERGMIQIAAQGKDLITPEMRAWARTSEAAWVDALTITELDGHDASKLASSPLLAHVNRLDFRLDRSQPAISLLFHASRSEGLGFLKYLKLEHCGLIPDQIELLVCFPLLRRLTLLDLRHNRLNDVAAHVLSDCLHLRNLFTLRLGGNRFTPEGIALLRDAFGERVHF